MVLWDGACHVHEQFSLEKILALKKQYPEAQILAHPECKKVVLTVADYIGSTSALLAYTDTSDCNVFIVATESGILHKMKQQNPTKTFIPAPPNDSTCACNECNFMRLNTLEKLYNCLLNETPEIQVEETIRQKAVKPILKMLEMSK
jgi:quinolinate synthase